MICELGLNCDTSHACECSVSCTDRTTQMKPRQSCVKGHGTNAVRLVQNNSNTRLMWLPTKGSEIVTTIAHIRSIQERLPCKLAYAHTVATAPKSMRPSCCHNLCKLQLLTIAHTGYACLHRLAGHTDADLAVSGGAKLLNGRGWCASQEEEDRTGLPICAPAGAM